MKNDTRRKRPGPSPRPIAERFWAKVDKNGAPPAHRPHLGRCWEWTGQRKPRGGYGVFHIARSQPVRATHRLSWELTHGRIPSELQVLHRCDNPPCVRPDHLFLGTHEDNMRDMVEKGRQSSRGVIRGEDNASAKLTNPQVNAIRSRYYAGGVLQRELAAKFGISQAQVSRIVRGVERANGFTGDHRSRRRAHSAPLSLTPEQHEIVKQRRAAGETLRVLAADFGVSPSLISLIARTR